jgi:hypothetical protein
VRLEHLYDRAGNPISFERWRLLFEDKRYQQVAADHVGEVLVSTVWLGLDHGWLDTPPIIFETMVFGAEQTGDDEQHRYSTEAEALAGHQRIVEELRILAAALT